MNIKVCTFNVKGLGESNKRKQSFEWLKFNNYAICFLQEMHCEENIFSKWQKEWGHDAFFSGNSKRSTGVGILVNSNFNYKIIEHTEIIKGRLQSLKLNINDKYFLFLNVYGPNNENTDFLSYIEQFIIANDNESLIVGGDFNTIIDTKLDKKNGYMNYNKRKRDKIISIISNNDITDIWRLLNPTSRHYTWHSNHRPPIFCRLDYFLVSCNLVNSISKCKISVGIRSDYSIVYFNINIDNQPRGPSYFKLNNSIILEQEYQNKIKNAIKDISEINKNCNANIMWELIKGTVRNVTIQYTSLKKKNEKREEDIIRKEIDDLDIQLSNDTENEILLNSLKEKKVRLENIFNNKTNGIILRAKAEWVEGGEKNTKYFANLEKKRSETKTIKRLLIDNTELTNPESILNETQKFYAKLYKNINVDMRINDFFTQNVCSLNDDEREICEGKLNENEILSALKEMKNNKSPGSDGISTEFYKIFWNDIKSFYIKSINFSYENGNLTSLQKQGIITLLPKKDKDSSNLNNWRPISLLNVDYKLATKSIANRMKKVLPCLINNSQTGFLKGRYIGENIRTIFEIIEQLNELDQPGLIFFADFEKAFDSVDHDFIFKVLEHFKFGNSLIDWVKLFYNNAQSCVSNNGYMSNFFNIERGVRQGCPLSPYLFILAIETLYKYVQNDNEIIGCKVGSTEIKNTAFADDATFMLNGNKKSFEKLIQCIHRFSLVSGLKLNNKKSIILRIGSLKNSNEIFCADKKFIWTNEKAATLGIVFSNDKVMNHELNLKPKISEFCNCLDRWKKYKLSIFGKVTVIKTFALPKLIYPLTVLNNPSSEDIKTIKNKMFDFLWDGTK